jgi:small subunit ribosomal protein S3
MGHKIHPTAFRIGLVKDWKSRWFGKKNYQKFLEEDFVLRTAIEVRLAKAAVEDVQITRSGGTVFLTVRSARPGLIIGRGGKGLEDLQRSLRSELSKLARRRGEPVTTLKLDVEELRRPESYATLLAKSVAEQLERRLPFRRVMKQTIEKVMQQKGVEGVKISLAGRLGGAEIARTEQLAKGKIPLQTLRADIDYSQRNARTAYGTIGVKVWIYKGEVFGGENSVKDRE